MDDNKIIELYFNRDEMAIELCREKYGKYILTLLFNMLGDSEACEECESDTYFRAWNSIPPTRPTSLLAFLSKIARNLALDKLRAEKNSPPLKMTVILDEISEIIPDSKEDLCDELYLKQIMGDFVREIDPTSRKIFLMRYFYMTSVKDIAAQMRMREGSVKSVLYRTRQNLRVYLSERGIEI